MPGLFINRSNSSDTGLINTSTCQNFHIQPYWIAGIYEDAHIFARALHHLGNFNVRDYQANFRLYQRIVKNLTEPDLLIHLRAPVPILLERIRRRARQIESSMNEDHLSLLENYYNEWVQDFDLCPVLTIRSDDLDFIHQPEHLDIIVQRIKDRLSGKEEIVF